MKTYNRKHLLECATEVLSWVALQDPMYRERIDITQSEYHLDDLQTLTLYCARTLDFGEHMWFAEREFMQPGYAGHLGSRICEVCKTEFTPGRPTDVVCDRQACLAQQAQMLDDQFESSARKRATR